MEEFFKIIIAFFAVIGLYFIVTSFFRRFSIKYTWRQRGTYLYIPSSDNDQIIFPFEELVKKEKIIIIVRSERERNDVINDLIEKFGIVYKYNFI